ncbi:hypothetical protein KQH60_11220 [Mycetohabitans sp. B8]|uniref:hypothetical protein n=1 Tax=Mycetohabitans sp. B8 TaxID=2841845 RepID=UPI001F47403A|nr:hypothetical protein [Mycetohabitans sp. B8]MCG1043076.1 hypothetical protein [Mycetohabitans sp. B8]
MSEKQQKIREKLDAKEKPSEKEIQDADDEAFAEGIRLSLIQHAASDVSRADATQTLDASRSAATDSVPLQTHAGIKRQQTESENGRATKRLQSLYIPLDQAPRAFYQPLFAQGNIEDNAPEESESPHQK